MRQNLISYLLVLSMISMVYGGYEDTGFIEWQQPNGITFTARLWGDEFLNWMETQNGYRIVQGADVYYYYAVLDGNGDFAPSDSAVGINQPLADSYQLEHSPSCIAEIEAEIEAFNQQLAENAQWFAAKQAAAGSAPVTIKLGVVLVDFTPSERYKDINYPDGYLKAFFDSLMFSTDWYKTDTTLPPPQQVLSPDGQQVFGSFRDYFNQQSLDKLDIIGIGSTPGDTGRNIFNPDSAGSGLPLWVKMTNDYLFYNALPGGFMVFKDSVFARMLQMGMDTTGSHIDKWAIIVSRVAGGALWTQANAIGGKYYLMGERFQAGGFSHIGRHCHEFGHLIGAADEYAGNTTPDRWAVMATGDRNGPNYGSCPAGFAPYYRLKWNWASADTLTTDTLNLNVVYDHNNPSYYFFPAPGSSEYFLLENRLREGFDLWTPNDPSIVINDTLDRNGNTGGLLIWHNAPAEFSSRDAVQIERADGISSFSTLAGDPFPYIQNDDNGSGESFNDHTTPGSYLRNNVTPSGIAINNITWNAGDSSTTVDVFQSNPISQNTTWSGAVTLNRNTYVEEGVTLTIEAGTVINVSSPITGLKSGLSFLEGSTLIAQGTPQAPIVFQSASQNPQPGGWRGLYFVTTVGENFQLNNITFRDAKVGITFDHDLLSLTLEKVQFIDNNQSIHIAGKGYFSWAFPWQIFRCYFENSPFDLSDAPVDRIAKPLTFHNNIMTACDTAFTMTAILMENKATIENNVFINNNTGFFLDSIPSDKMVILKNNIFANNQVGIRHIGNTPDTISYNAFWNNGSNSITGDSALFANPQFVDITNGNYHLLSTSPCIDRGDPTDSYANEPYPNGGRINMGAYGNTEEATLSFNIIAQNNLTANTTWSGYVNVLEDISTDSYTLTIKPGTKILFDNQTSLTITGELSSDGDDPELGPDPIVFSGYRETDQMAGVIISAGDGEEGVTFRHTHFKKGSYGLYIDELAPGENLFENLTFQDNATGLYSSGAEFDLANSYFKNNQTGFTAHDGSIYLNQCNFDSNSVQGLYLLDAEFWIHNCNFRDNGRRGVYFDYSSDGNFYDNIVSGNGYASEFPLRGGLVFYQSSPFIYNNRVYANQAPGVLSLSSAYPIMVVDDGSNFIAVNGVGSSELDPEILVHDISFPILDYGYNDIADTLGGDLVYGNEDSRDITLNIRENYWGTTDSSEIADRLHRPSGFDFTPFSTDWNTGGFSFNKGTGHSENILAEAFRAERDSNYTSAITLYDSLVNDTSLAVETKAALERLYLLKLKTGENINTIKAYFDNLSSHPDEALATVARRIAIRCLTYDEEYQTAIGEHSAWAQTTPYFCDSVYSEIDILTNEFLASGSPFGKTTGGKMGKKGAVTAQQLKAQQTRLARYQQETEKLLNLLFDSPTHQTSPLIPREFALSQNYPNPFNPATTIEYQLPFDSKVKIEIYNILGQRVKTLIDRREPAGKYKITWNGRNDYGSRVASGLYVYRIQADTKDKIFVKSKKMILLK